MERGLSNGIVDSPEGGLTARGTMFGLSTAGGLGKILRPMNAPLHQLVIASLFLASGLAWTSVLLGRLRGKPLEKSEVRTRAPIIPPAALVIGLFLLFVFAAGPVAAEFLPEGPEAEEVSGESSDMLNRVQTAAGFDLSIAIVLLAAIGSVPGGWRECGIHAERIGRQLWDGVLGFQLAIGPVFAMVILTTVAGLRTDESTHEFLQFVQSDSRAQAWAWVTFTAVIGAPLAEELLFRVILQGWLERYVHPALAITFSSLQFSFVHNYPDSLGLLPLALVLGTCYHLRRSLLSIVVIHALFNGVMLWLTALGEA
jgi:membrane protease YdiL (CAAX protease family)